ncbi:MAG: branched-chain amino acid aminotransferase [Saprospiraceae bacterium]|jgi:branched-chain amino acid aminotransferase|nr:branched-chain amino acid aminotransferase [Saprospiraceae bacterium]MBK6667531.1 branched-chain amino acid aminotransferase [Saprospiraceae bacterium]MBK7697836.1 branched-chain amino acid aminotransferase [Saprospiraceae bacterium]MBK9580992.1 branched-chain amino acid aminotransferase [Saprospiraceae bacterium]MBK9743836.1 branched-chain amino acid aminotransferase [Saprospiraceae bacterium]
MSYKFNVTRVQESSISKVDFNNLPFGKTFSDHMFVADYINGAWTNLEIRPVAPIPTHPGNMAWHYGQAIFEGMKATRDAEGHALLFRPELHAVRLNNSAKRMSMPEVPEDLFLQAIHTLVDMEKAWIPPQTGSALYIRPFMYATDETIGVKASDTYKFIIFVMPVGPYYTNPVKLLAQDKYVRAVVGGVGEAKTAGNYAASLLPSTMARKEGFDQVMWLDGVHKKYIQEVGTMNIFFVVKDEIITPNLDGAILDGITRKSMLELFKDQGYKVTERPITIDEIIEAGQSGDLVEIFGTGTAAVIAPVSHLKYKDTTIELDMAKRQISKWAYDTINGIRNRTVTDKFGWIVEAKP